MTKYFMVGAAALGASVAAAGGASAQAPQICAQEGGFCSAPEGAIIHFGANGATAYRVSPAGGLPCDVWTFGDPLFLKPKVCTVSYPAPMRAYRRSAIVARG